MTYKVFRFIFLSTCELERHLKDLPLTNGTHIFYTFLVKCDFMHNLLFSHDVEGMFRRPVLQFVTYKLIQCVHQEHIKSKIIQLPLMI